MTALDAIDKRAIYFIEGTGQSGFVTAWGDGFVTNKGVISQNGLSDPTAFFDRLSTMPFLNRVSLPPVHTAAWSAKLQAPIHSFPGHAVPQRGSNAADADVKARSRLSRKAHQDRLKLAC